MKNLLNKNKLNCAQFLQKLVKKSLSLKNKVILFNENYLFTVSHVLTL